MLEKFLKVHKFTFFERPRPPKPASASGEEGLSTALKIVHGGGIVECYYMAMPAIRIVEKYPSFLLARPQVFRRPWDSLVRPDEILSPGEKFFLVPRRTVRKLQRRIRKPSTDNSRLSYLSQTSNDISDETIYLHWDIGFSRDVSSTSINNTANRKRSSRKKHVTFAGIDPSVVEKKGKEAGHSSRKSGNPKSNGGKRRARKDVAWQPSLTAISERV
ncbi:hypothetical protein I3843_03G261200 [Carya illinoinensis]|uniref:Uncharacterized protein n=1 Tax=Carya illinoinensis TaxID=32201 RepID=A0A8T1R9H6_CARIL|nr:hypothetical protein I3760_03G274000 [Carya illinoinensis]KAG6663033.1 hypothetical protein CIPAW_03G283400 [Carya illinoinensis]KAG6724758.1 hypothetical protein I3842_03G272300 [Carya illinoinensis]KAG7989909.1 hypothetical protein I3843_03G261200 [Carya illinoinensis]